MLADMSAQDNGFALPPRSTKALASLRWPGIMAGMEDREHTWLIPAIIVAAALILMPIIWIALSLVLRGAGDDGFGASLGDSYARIELERMRGQLDGLSARIDDLEQQVISLTRRGDARARPDPDAEDAVLRGTGPNDILDSYAQVVLIPDRLNVNRGLEVATPAYLEEKLGRPRETLSDKCEPMTNEELKSKLVLTQVGPIQVNMLQPAVDSLKRVFAAIKRADPDLYARINTAGSLCVRRIRGSQNRLSTHSYGLAVDLNVDGKLDNFTDGKTQLGLIIMADFFHAEGWVWGAGFSREDSMHFEISRKQLDEWLAAGLL